MSPPSPNPVPAHQQKPHTTSPPLSLILTVIILLVFFLGFFCVLLCRCLVEAFFQRWNPNPDPNSGNPDAADHTDQNLGLDPSLIQTFPTFTYASVKDFRREKYGLECAICLSEFSGEDMLRLITVCYHVFHQECIDLWLESHKTCPVCRQDLDLPKEALLEKVPTNSNNNTPSRHPNPSDGRLENSVTIEITGEVEDEGDEGGENEDGKNSEEEDDEESNRKEKMADILSRSHSTGHEFQLGYRRGEKKDRYTLRLVDSVRMKIISPSAGHIAAESCITFGEFSSSSPATNGGFGELSGCPGPDLPKQ